MPQGHDALHELQANAGIGGAYASGNSQAGAHRATLDGAMPHSRSHLRNRASGIHAPRGRNAGSLPLIAVGVALALGCAESKLAPLPRPVLDEFAAPVQRQLRKALQEAQANPASAARVGELGRVLFAYGQHQGAAQCFERSRALEPSQFAWAYLLGAARAELGESAAAIAALRAAASLRPADLATSLRLADQLERSGQTDQARAALRTALASSPAAAAHFRLGRLELGLASPAAHSHLEKALELDPDFREARYALSHAYRRAGRHAEAVRQLDLYEQMDPIPRRHYDDPLIDGLEAIRASSVQEVFGAGRALQDRGDFDGALAAYNAALEIDPAYAQAHVNLIAIHGQSGRQEQAERHYRRAVELNPAIAEAHYNYGVSRYFAGDYSGAEAAFRKALEINPLDADARSNLGNSLEKLERGSEAERHYRLALDSNPAQPMANFHLGRRLADRGRFREALPFLERAIAQETVGTALHAYLLALVHRQLGDSEAARDRARFAVQQARSRGQADLAAKIEADLLP